MLIQKKKNFKNPSYIFPLHTLSELHSFSGCFILVLLHSSPGIFPCLKNLTQNAYYVIFIFFFWMKCFSKILFWFNLYFTTFFFFSTRELYHWSRVTVWEEVMIKKPKKSAQAATFDPSVWHMKMVLHFLKFTLTIWIIAINTVKESFD